MWEQLGLKLRYVYTENEMGFARRGDNAQTETHRFVVGARIGEAGGMRYSVVHNQFDRNIHVYEVRTG